METWQKLASIDPSNAKVVVKSWPIPQAFTAADGALWMVTPNQQTLQKRSPSSLSIQRSFGVGGATGGVAGRLWLTYGASFLWLSQSTPNSFGQVNKISPTGGLVKGAVSPDLGIGVNCTVAGGTGVWTAVRADPANALPAALVELSQDTLAELGRATLPPGANPGAVNCVVAGGGLVYVTDGVGAVYTIQP